MILREIHSAHPFDIAVDYNWLRQLFASIGFIYELSVSTHNSHNFSLKPWIS